MKTRTILNRLRLLRGRVPNGLLVLVVGLAGCAAPESRWPPFADVHLHYNWDHAETITAAEAARMLHERNVVFGVVSSVPSDYARQLVDAGQGQIIALWSPYYRPGNRHDWFFDEEVVKQARIALASGAYAGLGEMHLTAGLGPRRDNPVVQGLLQLAREYRVAVLIHTDASSHRYFLPLCRQYPELRFLWAHAGGILGPDELAPLLEACPNVWLDFAARAPWHYGGFADGDGHLEPAWRAFLLRYQDRIVTGTDPVWNAQQVYKWDEADQGWRYYDRMFEYQHRWLMKLPPAVAEKIRLTNALRLFGRSRDGVPLRTGRH